MQQEEHTALVNTTLVINSNQAKTEDLIKNFFTTCNCHPYDEISWEKRSAVISNDSGEAVFKQDDIEVPCFWSQMATNVVASKYFRGEINTPERENSLKTLIDRVVKNIRRWGENDGYFQSPQEANTFEYELTYLLVNQFAAFNSPVWFNVGTQVKPQCSACFIVSVNDSIDSLLELQAIEGRLFKYGSGTGSNLSSIRSSKEKLAGGGKPSGPVSFMKGFDAWASVIKSGGKTRRAAKMQILNINHPDIEDFIQCKCIEEKKAWALIEQGYDGGFAVPGGAYDSVAFQNANLSVRASDEFMQAVVGNKKFSTRNVTDNKPCNEYNAKDLMRLIAEGTHTCGDPGMQFDDTINYWHTCPESGRINASNPCSEYMHLDDSACNLSSLNLVKFLEQDGSFNSAAFCHAIEILICAQDILVSNSSYPTKKIERCANDYRQLGLGYANLGALLMSLGLPYNSQAGRDMAASITSLMSAQAYKTSAMLAKNLGAFTGYKRNRTSMLNIIRKHLSASEKLADTSNTIKQQALDTWRVALSLGSKHGFRNAQTTVLAPTGTISFMMDCDTTGIEPDIALVKYKKLVGGGLLKLVNACVPKALKKLGYTAEQIKIIINYIDQNNTIEGCAEIKTAHLDIFDCAFKATKGQRYIDYKGHLKMMAAVQPYISGAISKTVNLPRETSVEEIENIYIEAWQAGLKAVALYRDGSKRTQPLSTAHTELTSKVTQPIRKRLPDERQAITHKLRVGSLEGYLTVGLFEDGSPGEIFLVVAKEGSTLSGIMDAFATAVSMALQYGVPLVDLVRKFSYVRFEPAGFTGNKDIPSAQSIIDYVFRWLALKFLQPEQIASLGLKNVAHNKITENKTSSGTIHNNTDNNNTEPASQQNSKKSNSSMLAGISVSLVNIFQNSEDAPPCTNCGLNLMVRQAGCYVCLNCGAQGGCG